MAEFKGFASGNYNPDVLSCLANLSNDEVFTPPALANDVLDLLPAEIWRDSSVTFLDPCTKTGIFLREITKRLIAGLEDEIPDLQQRINHILTKQVYGLAITELTALLARRSLYCSKFADGQFSIATKFKAPAGNVKFDHIAHTWVGGRCQYCGASQSEYDRSAELETHAYHFIHEYEPKRIFKMQFDVIVGNPPYQLSDGGFGKSATPIYQFFVEQAKKLNPRYLTMVVPSRWLFGGRGLDDFRKAMLTDNRIRILVDYPDSRQVFPSVDVAGGICYFLWDRDHTGDCRVVEFEHGLTSSQSVRPLLEEGAEVFIRSNRALAILRKVMEVETGSKALSLPETKRFDTQVSSQKPFGLRTFFRGSEKPSSVQNVLVLQSGGRAWTSRSEVTVGEHLVDKWKVFTSKSSSEHAGQVDKNGQRRVLSLSGVIPPGSVVTESYILLGAYDTEEEAYNCFSYVVTRFFRFLVATRSSAQDLARSAYSFVPLQDFSKPWTDEELYAKYDLTDDEIAFIESLIRPMDLTTADEDDG